MAYIRKRGKKYQVRWRDPDGQQRYQSCPNKKTAKQLQHEVEQAVALGRRWEEPDRNPSPLLEGMMEEYLKASQRSCRPSTVGQRAIALTLFMDWLKLRNPRKRIDIQHMSRAVLEAYYDHLIQERGVSQLTASDRIRHIGMFWNWVWNHDDYESCPRPRFIKLPDATPQLAPVAPSWAEMDQAVRAAGESWYQQLFLILRYTGLRKGQVMKLRWDDLNFEDGMLTIRPELGKTKQERRGRVIPVSVHLLDELAGWGRREGFIVDTTRSARGPVNRSRAVHNGYVKAIWQRTSVPKDRYRQPCHSFRKGFISGLVQAGADGDAVKALVGHSRGVTGDVYISSWAIEDKLRAAVALVPAIETAEQATVLQIHRRREP